MARGLHKEWKNGRHLPLWTCRIKWYQQGDGKNIRLQMMDSECELNYYPLNKEDADSAWKIFKEQAPPQKEAKVFVAELIRILTETRGGFSNDPASEVS